MERMLILMLSFMSLLLSIILYKKAAGTLKFLNIPSIFFYFYIIMVYIGSLFIFLGLDKASIYLNATDEVILLKLLTSTSLGLILIPLGMIYANTILKFDSKAEYRNYLNKDISMVVTSRDRHIFLILILFVFLSLVVLIIYLRKLEVIPIIAAIKGASSAELAYYRSQATNNFQGKIHRFSVFYFHLLPHISRVFFIYYLKNKRSKLLKIVTLILIMLSMFTQSMVLYKEPIVFYLVSLFILYYYVNYHKYNFRKLIKVGFISILLITCIYIAVMNTGDRNFIEVLQLPINRAFVGQIRPLYFYYKMIPEYQPYLLGRAFPNPGGILPFEPYRLVVEVHYFTYPYLLNSNIVGSSPTVFWGEVYANFGYWSIFPTMFLFGFIIQLIHIVFVSYLPKNPIYLATYVYLMIIVKNLNGMPFSYLIVNIYIVTILLVNLFTIITARSLKKYRSYY